MALLTKALLTMAEDDAAGVRPFESEGVGYTYYDHAYYGHAYYGHAYYGSTHYGSAD